MFKEVIKNTDISIEKTNEQLEIKDIIKPIETFFKDNRNKNCLSLQIGYKYEWFFYKELAFPMYSHMLIFKEFLEIISRFQENAYFILLYKVQKPINYINRIPKLLK